jgi:microcystin degradation protein MlrC
MRIAIGQLWQETNTFNPIPTHQADFEAFGVLRGPALIEQMADTNELGGFIQSLRAWREQPEIVGLVRLPAWPGGMATAATFRWLREELVAALRGAGPIDAVLLALHGSLVAEGHPDGEGEILSAFREVLGPYIPLVATLDLHANITRRMVESADSLVLYHTAPHIDVFETGQRGAAVLRRNVAGARPITAFAKLPLVVPAERANTQDPASISHAFRKRLIEFEKDPRILSAGLATVQPWLDIPELGSAVVVVTDNHEQLAKECCSALADEVWRQRQEYLPVLTPVEEAVRQAWSHTDGLVIISDSADATTSGAPGDSNHVLRELLKYDWPRPALAPLVDPGIVNDVGQLGPGAKWTGPLGGKRDTRNSRPMTGTWTVGRLFEARFTLSGHLGRNLPIDMGPSAVLSQGNVHVILTSRSGPHFAPQFFATAGFDPFAASVVIAKSPCGFRAAYADKASLILLAKAPGCAPADFWTYDFRHIPRPLWPWDEIDSWKARPWITKRNHGEP